MTTPYAYKPLGIKSYGHVPHLPGSRLGPGDHHCHDGQRRIATEKVRDRRDEVIVQEKLDGSNVGVALVGGEVVPLVRSGWHARSSRLEQHAIFADWVALNHERFRDVLRDGERLCGEWLAQAHGTRYALEHGPLVAFDLMAGHDRLTYDEFVGRLDVSGLPRPGLVHRGAALSVERAMEALAGGGFHGAVDPVEGAVWRVERDVPGRGRVVDFLVKYVRPDKTDGAYLPEVSGQPAVWNWRPARCST